MCALRADRILARRLSSANTSSTPRAKTLSLVFEPEPISTLFEKMPVVAQSLQDTLDKLEMHFKNMQDIEFTIDSGKLFILQTRNGKHMVSLAINVAATCTKKA